MMRRFTSAPKPSPRDCAVHVDEVARGPPSDGRSERRRSGPGCSTPPPWRRDNTSQSHTGCAAAKCRSTFGAQPLVHLQRGADGAAPPRRRGRRRSIRAATPMVSGCDRFVDGLAVRRHRPDRRWCYRADRGRRSTSSSSAASVTSWAKGPIWSSELAKATRPKRDTRPYDGFMPTRPHRLGGLADRAAGVGAQRQRRFARRHRRGRAAAAAAGNALQVPRIARRLIGAVLRGRTHRELVHVRLAEQHRVGLPQLRDDVGVVGRHELLQNLAAAGRRLAARAEHVLDRDGHAGEWAELVAVLAAAIDGAACSSASASSTCRNACTCGSRWRMASRKASRQRFGVTSPRDRDASSATAVCSIMASHGDYSSTAGTA